MGTREIWDFIAKLDCHWLIRLFCVICQVESVHSVQLAP